MEWTASDYSALGVVCGLVIVNVFVILRAYIRARKEDKRRMVKYYCDLCGQEIADCLPYGGRDRRFMIKELRWNKDGNRKEWQEIIAHDDCITKLLKPMGVPMGVWIRVGADCWRCSVCMELTDDCGRYCSNCGAKMTKEDKHDAES